MFWLKEKRDEKGKFASEHSTLDARFLSYAEKRENGCWIWKGAPLRTGYGAFRLDGKTWGAHRASWAIFRGEIPTGLCVCHKCDVRLCVNPDHLFLGTVKENMEDMVRKGRSGMKGGFARIRQGYCMRNHDLAVTAVKNGGGNRQCGVCLALSRATRKQRAARNPS